MSVINIMKTLNYMKIMEQQDMSGLLIHQNITMEQGIPLMHLLRNSL